MASAVPIIATLGSTGLGAAQLAGVGGGGGGAPLFAQAPRPRNERGIQSYMSRLFALNAGATPPTFREFLANGGTSKFPLEGVGQFTPTEAVQLRLAQRGKRKDPIPWYTSSQAGELTPEQHLFLKQQQKAASRQRRNMRSNQPGDRKKKDDPVKINIGVDTGDWKEK